MIFPRFFLKAKEENEILLGSPWIYDNEILFVKYLKDGRIQQESFQMAGKTLPKDGGSDGGDFPVEDGTPVEVYSKSGLFLGTGIFNGSSRIAIRLLSEEKPHSIFGDLSHLEGSRRLEGRGILAEKNLLHSQATRDFFLQLVKRALDLRYLFYKKADSYRLIFGESDGIPGLVVDRYYDVEGHVFLSIQFLSLAAEIFREEILSALESLCRPFGIFERSDVHVRELEGLELRKGWIGPERNPRITIRENGILLKVDLEQGQKTGYFLDQKENRRVVASLSQGRRVLDTFTHTGAFGLNALAGGAKSVVSVDISPEAVATVEENIVLNKALCKEGRTMEAVCCDVFDLLRRYQEEGRQFDLIVLDPPAFAKSAGKVDKAYGGYKEINLRAMKLLVKGGILVTCSCSHFMDSDTFYDMVAHAAKDAHKKVQILERRGAGPDHPQLVGYDKGEYLKCAVVRVL